MPQLSRGRAGAEGRPKRVGHKGADALVHGNTAASFDAALAAGVDMIEFDVLPERLDGTGELRLAHDFKDARERTPLRLDEGLAHLAQPQFAHVQLDVDMKLQGYEQRTVDALRRHGLAERSLISTMEKPSLTLLRKIAPQITIGWSFPRAHRDLTDHRFYRWPAYAAIIYYRIRLPWMAAKAIREGRVDALMCHWAFVTPRLARAVRDVRGELYVWTVDDAEQIDQFERLGIAGVISNDPHLFPRA
jgi:glycerophosphoryl diester phosphodiesterase